jgi:uncharacterized CHY-type Zn-finger protein
MTEENVSANTIVCDACRKEISKSEVRYMSLKMCCKVERLPLCKECWEKYANKNNKNN